MKFCSARYKGIQAQKSVLSDSLHKKRKSEVTKIVNIQTAKFEKILETYRWRAETQFPIVKVRIGQVLPGRANLPNPKSKRLQVILQEPAYRLTQLSDIPLFRVMYLLKQSLIGLERLFTKFGCFLFRKDMIFITQAGKCKVWMNQKIESNQFIPIQLKQSEFLIHVYTMFVNKTFKTKQSSDFFDGLKSCKSFFQALGWIDSFVQKKKISVPTSFKLIYSSNAATSLEKGRRKFETNLTMSKKPQFLTSLELKCGKQQRLSKSKQSGINSSMTSILKIGQPSKLWMKASGDTAAQSEKNRKQSYQSNCVTPKKELSKILNENGGFTWNSDKLLEPGSRMRFNRKFSNYTEDPSSPIQTTNSPMNFPAPIQNQVHQVPYSTKVSFTFCKNFRQCKSSSRSSSASNKKTLVEKKKAVFNKNGWEMKVNTLFAKQNVMKRSYCAQQQGSSIKRNPTKLHLLDKCQTNLCESFMAESEDL